MAKDIFGVIKNMIKFNHSLGEIQFLLKDRYSFEETKLAYDYVINKEENRLKKRLSFRMTEKLYNKIKNSEQTPSYLIKLALEEFFARESR